MRYQWCKISNALDRATQANQTVLRLPLPRQGTLTARPFHVHAAPRDSIRIRTGLQAHVFQRRKWLNGAIL